VQSGELFRPGLDRQPELTAQVVGRVDGEPETGDRQGNKGGQSPGASNEAMAAHSSGPSTSGRLANLQNCSRVSS
jgi:hypothetical protein